MCVFILSFFCLFFVFFFYCFFKTFLFKLKPSQAKACSPSCSSKTGMDSICRVCPLDSSKNTIEQCKVYADACSFGGREEGGL